MNTINGLHTCKPQNTPRVGEVKPFEIVDRIGKTGKPWKQIKNPQNGQGLLFNIMTVEKTNYSDANGNVSFNLTLEPVDGGTAAAPQAAHSAPQQSPQRVFNAGEGKDSPRQHLMRAANLYKLCMDCVDAVIYPAGARGPEDEAWRSAVASLYIEASRRRSDDGQSWWSYTNQMPDKPMKEEKAPNEASPVNQQEPEPF